LLKEEIKNQENTVQDALEPGGYGAVGLEAEGMPKSLEPIVKGTKDIIILKHRLFENSDMRNGKMEIGVELAIRNISAATIATAIFEAIFYDIDNNMLDTVKHKEIELKPNTSRAININSSMRQFGKIKRYEIRIIKVTTADMEKVQVRRNAIRTTESGAEEIRGAVNNIGCVKTDTALIATFYDRSDECIGSKVIIIRDIEPGALKQYNFLFKPQEGDVVKSYKLNIGDVVE
jgi:hypothetical protein